jgi:ketosteroid isomerase-like protein
MTAKELGQTSLARTKAKDRAGWLALFATDAVVEDPVAGTQFGAGSAGHQGIDAIAAFYDNTISLMESFEYDIERAYLCGNEAALVVAFRIGVGGSHLDMDVVNIYAANADGKLQSLRSFWDGTRQGG